MDNFLLFFMEQFTESIEEFIALYFSAQENNDEIFREVSNVLHLFTDELNTLQIVPREIGLARISNYYESIIPRYTDEEFHSHFRMTRKTFEVLSRVIEGNVLSRRNLQEEEEMPVNKRIYITIWILATPDSFRSVADRFGVSKSTAYNAYKEILCILCRLIPTYINWPDSNELANIENVFHQRFGFPGVVGAIDGCHIQIKQPPGNANDYYNRKGTHSIVLQGTCDHNGKFLDVLIGAPGRAHDARIWQNSSLHRKITDEQNPLLPPDKHLLGDAGYLLHINLLTPFRNNGHLSTDNVNYNIKHASTRSIIERAFGRLKNKFRRLYYLDVQSVSMAILVVGASCMLHNFILMHDVIHCEPNPANEGPSTTLGDQDAMDEFLDDGDDDNIIDLNAIQKRLQIMQSLV